MEKTLDFFPKENKRHFDSKEPIYFYSSHRSLIFKGDIIFNSPFKVSVRWPMEILVKDERLEDREEIKAHADVDFKNLKISMPVLEVSQHGLSIRVPRSEALYFEELDIVKVKIKNREKMGVIRYIKQFNNPVYKTHYRIGISL